MAKFLVPLFCALLLGLPHSAFPQKTASTIADFKVQALYRAAKLTWKATDGLKKDVPVQIMRSDISEEGPYKDLETVKLTPGKSNYEYVDKSMGSEAKYYYKLVIKETKETFGPLVTRPFFSPPAT